jgi:hypothetical protein
MRRILSATFTIILFSSLQVSQEIRTGKSLDLKIEILPELVESFKNESINVELSYGNFKIDTSLINSTTFFIDSINYPSLWIRVSGSIKCADSISTNSFYILDKVALTKSSLTKKTIVFPFDCSLNRYRGGKICPKCKLTDRAIPIYRGHPDPTKIQGTAGIDYELCCPILSACDPRWHCKRDSTDY